MNFDLAIIDGLNIAYKYYYGHKALHDKSGRSTGLYYGFLNFLLSLPQKFPIKKFVIVWDSPSLKKNIESPEYKSGSELFTMTGVVRKIVTLLGADQMYALGYEADDIAAKLVKENMDKSIILVSEDEDWNMFLGTNVAMFRRNKLENYTQFLKKSEGINSYELKLFWSMTGTHNNISGVGVNRGLAIRAAILAAGSVEMLFANGQNYLDRKDGQEPDWVRFYNTVLENRDKIRSNFKAIAPVTEGYEVETIPGKRDIDGVLEFCREFELNSVIKKLGGTVVTS